MVSTNFCTGQVINKGESDLCKCIKAATFFVTDFKFVTIISKDSTASKRTVDNSSSAGGYALLSALRLKEKMTIIMM